MRQWIKLSALVLSTGLATSALFTAHPAVAADETAPSTQPAKEAREAKKPGKLVKKWSAIEEMLSADQKAQIIAIHQKAVEDAKAIDKKEEADIMAILTPEQVEALKAGSEKSKTADKMKTAEKKDAAKPKEEPKGD